MRLKPKAGFFNTLRMTEVVFAIVVKPSRVGSRTHAVEMQRFQGGAQVTHPAKIWCFVILSAAKNPADCDAAKT